MPIWLHCKVHIECLIRTGAKTGKLTKSLENKLRNAQRSILQKAIKVDHRRGQDNRYHRND